MTELCNYRRIANPYIQDVWITNPDNIAIIYIVQRVIMLV